MKDFRDLKVWQKGHQLALAVYRHTRTFPKEELYGLTSQIRRATVSIPANIAEGCGRGSPADFARFLQMAMGSASEVEYHFLLARELGLVHEATHAELHALVVEIKRMLTSLIQRIKADS